MKYSRPLKEFVPANPPIMGIPRRGKFNIKTVTTFRPNARKVGYGSRSRIVQNKFIVKLGQDLAESSPHERRRSRAYGHTANEHNISFRMDGHEDQEWAGTTLPVPHLWMLVRV